MSIAETQTGGRGKRLETVLIAGFAMLLIFAIFYVMSQRQQVLRTSPSGFDGLKTWLSSEDISAQSFLGGWQIDQTSIGILVIPVFDTIPGEDRDPPRTKEELLFQQDEYDLQIGAILEKAERVPSLVILPKWRSGLRLTGLAHPVLLSERRRMETLLHRLTGQRDVTIQYAPRPFTDFDYVAADGTDLSAQIYAAQMFTSADCRPLIGTRDAMLLADCPLAGHGSEQRVLVLSDPDLLNNHGLRMGDNAFIARDLLGTRVGESNVLIDYSRDVWLQDRDGTRRERSWADLKRFFGPPFLTLWLGGALAFGLFIWRAWQRYGPVRADVVPGAGGKALAVRARARLMRLSDQDGALIAEYARARLAATASFLFGPADARYYAEPKAFLGYVARRHPERHRAFEQALTAIRNLPPRIPAAEAIRHVDELEALLEQITNDT